MVLNHEANHTFWRFGPVKGWLAALVEGKTSVVLSPDSDFFKYFGDLQGGRDRVSERRGAAR